MTKSAGEEQLTRCLWVFTFVLAAVLWVIHINRPVDLPSWHEFDYSSIARNFVREGNNILYPRIDWRGDGPGFTEMEFPIIPWTIAQLYRIFGMHEIIGRILSYVFMLLSLAVFCRIALKVLPERAAIVSALFFVPAHLVTLVAASIQPESLMLLFYLLAIYYFLDWYEGRSWISYILAILSFTSAMLVKSPAAHLAIFFLFWALHKDGLKAFRRPSLYLFAALSFAPVVLWYAHAATLWHQFHNSMGVSNEDHWFGMDILTRPKVIINLIGIDVLLVCGGGGAIVALAALTRGKLQAAVNRLAVYWCLAIGIYLIVIIRTAGAYWASYYQVIAVPPIALLFGAGVAQLQIREKFEWRRALAACVIAATLLIPILRWLGGRDVSRLPGILQDLLTAHSSLAGLAVLVALSLAVTVLCLFLGTGLTAVDDLVLSNGRRLGEGLTPLVIAGCFVYFFLSGQMLLGTWRTFANRTPQFASIQCLRDKIVPSVLIVASGGICRDPGGHRVASDAPEMFYWLDHKGFSTCEGQESITELKNMASRGARFFIADKVSMNKQPGFEAELRKSFSLLADCDTVELFRLQSR